MNDISFVELLENSRSGGTVYVRLAANTALTYSVDGGNSWYTAGAPGYVLSGDTPAVDYVFSTGLKQINNTVSVDIGEKPGQVVAVGVGGKIPRSIVPLSFSETDFTEDQSGTISLKATSGGSVEDILNKSILTEFSSDKYSWHPAQNSDDMYYRWTFDGSSAWSPAIALVRGPAGLDGAPGKQGDTGPMGPAGPAGQSAYEASGFSGSEQEWIDSLKGVSGNDGRSAYQIAVDNGFEGNEQMWLTSLIGPVGPAGLPGVDGTDGENGYTPIKGVDYFTEEDIAEIVSKVSEVYVERTW